MSIAWSLYYVKLRCCLQPTPTPNLTFRDELEFGGLGEKIVPPNARGLAVVPAIADTPSLRTWALTTAACHAHRKIRRRRRPIRSHRPASVMLRSCCKRKSNSSAWHGVEPIARRSSSCDRLRMSGDSSRSRLRSAVANGPAVLRSRRTTATPAWRPTRRPASSCFTIDDVGLSVRSCSCGSLLRRPRCTRTSSPLVSIRAPNFGGAPLSVRAQRSAPRGESPEAHVWRVVEYFVYVRRRHGSGRVTTLESRGL